MKNFTLLLTGITAALFISVGCTKKGCTNPNASNYEERAEKEDGSCKFFTRFKFGEVRVDEIPFNNPSGGVWDNTFVEFQNPDVFVAVYDSQGTLAYSSLTQYDNQFPTEEDPFRFDLSPSEFSSDFTQVYTLYVLDNDEFDSEIIAQKVIDLNELTDKSSSSKFPNSVAINFFDTDVRIGLTWAE